jgi:hypothetical protein
VDILEGLRDAARRARECAFIGRNYPVRVAFRGYSPVEHWCEEEREEPEPFGLNEVNRRLAALGREPE